MGLFVTDFIRPVSLQDKYPTHLDIYGKGGLHSLNTLLERDNIFLPRRKEGMIAYVKEDNSFYSLFDEIGNQNWKKIAYFNEDGFNIHQTLEHGYIFVGDKNKIARQSPILIDMRQDIIDLRRKLNYIDELGKLDPDFLWVGGKFGKAEQRKQIGIVNLPPLAEAVFPNPASGITGDFRIPNPTFDFKSAFDWVMSGPFLPQIYATKYNMLGNPIGTDISSSLAMTQVRAAQIMKRFDNANFIIGSSIVTFNWENPVMYLIPEPLKQLYGLGTTYTFTKAQSLGALTTGLLKNTVNDGTGTLSTAISGEDYVDFTEDPIGEIVVRPYPTNKYISTIPLRVEELTASLSILTALKVSYDLFYTETVAKDAAQDGQIAAINTKNTSQDASIHSAQATAEAAQTTADAAEETAVAAQATADSAEATAVTAEASVATLGATVEAEIAALAGVEAISALATLLGFIGLEATGENYGEFIRGQTLNVKNSWKASDLNDEGHNAVGDFEFRYPSGYSSDDRGHGTLWFDSNGRKEENNNSNAEPGLRIISWDSGGDHMGYDDPIAPAHIGIFGYQNKHNIITFNPTPVYKGFIFRCEFNNANSDDSDYRFPTKFGLYDVKRTISESGIHRWGWDHKYAIFEYDYNYFTFYKKLRIKEYSEFEKDIKFLTTGGIKIPVGDTTQRPVDSDIGCFRYNTDTGLEIYSGSSWDQFINKAYLDSKTWTTSQITDFNNAIDSANLTTLNSAKAYSDSGDSTTLASSKSYANSLITSQLSALSALSSFGIMVRTAANSFTTRSIGVGTGLSITNVDGISGNPTISLSTQLQSLNSLWKVGFVVSITTGPNAGTFANRALIKGAGINIINADGVAGNTIISVDNVPISNLANYPNNSAVFLCGNGTWAAINMPTNIPIANLANYPNDGNVFLCGNGTWLTPPTPSNIPIANLANYPNTTTVFLRGDGAWAAPTIPNNIPISNLQNYPNDSNLILHGDGTWLAPTIPNNIPISNLANYPNDSNVFLRGDGAWAANSVPSTNYVGDFKYSIRTSNHGRWVLWKTGVYLSRTTFAELWNLVVSDGLIAKGMFGAGDGTTTFTMGDIDGRVIGIAGSGSGLTVRSFGDKVGSETITQVPTHSHTINHDHASVTSSSDDHTHTFAHTHSISHSHSAATTNSYTHDHNLDAGGNWYVMYPKGNEVDGGFADYAGSGGAGPYKMYTSTIVLNTASNIHSHTVTVPNYTGNTASQSTSTTSSDTHTHTVDMPTYSGSSGDTGAASVNVMNPTVYMNLFIYV